MFRPVDVSPRLLPLSTDTVGAAAVGRSAATWTVSVAERVRPQFVPETCRWYVPGLAFSGTLTLTEAAVAVQPYRVGVSIDADQPDGRLSIRKRIRSKNVELRVTVTGTVPVPPLLEIVTAEDDASENEPSDLMRDTPSNGSW